MKIANIPHRVVDAARSRAIQDEQIEKMTGKELFIEFCEWHGLIRWGTDLFYTANALESIENERQS